MSTPAPPNTTTQRILAVTCLDFRGHTAIQKFLEDAGYVDRYDLVSMAGADLCLAHDGCPSAWMDTLLDNVDIGVALHDIKEVWVFGHQDCGACKKFGLIGNTIHETVEREVHRSIAEKSREVLKARFPDVVVRHLFVSKLGVDGVFQFVCDN